MPVKLGSKLPTENAEARIEIVPLIDIMFFLLAAFMLVSLSMVHAMTVKVNLPTAGTAGPDAMKDSVTISLDKSGGAYLDKRPIAENELRRALLAEHQKSGSLRVLISADTETRHGSVIHVLDLVRSAGIDKVAFDVQSTSQNPTP